jgi:tetratricopeptide (TPR) repeat protein
VRVSGSPEAMATRGAAVRTLATALAAVLLLAAGAARAADPAALVEQLQKGSVTERRAAALELGEVGDGRATASLAQALRDPDPGVREIAGAALWAIWHRSGDPALDAVLQEGIEHMEGRRFAEAVERFSEVIRRAPAFAEGWNKRATAYYLMGEWDKSLADCEEVVRRNPIHYGALSGFGLNYLQKDDLTRAAAAFEQALRVNPNLSGIEALLEKVRETLRQRRSGSV